MKYIYLNGPTKYLDDKCPWVLFFFGKHDHENNDRDNCYNQCPTSKEALGYIEQLIPDDLWCR